jgi:hypothetical protein
MSGLDCTTLKGRTTVMLEIYAERLPRRLRLLAMTSEVKGEEIAASPAAPRNDKCGRGGRDCFVAGAPRNDMRVKGERNVRESGLLGGKCGWQEDEGLFSGTGGDIKRARADLCPEGLQGARQLLYIA